MNTDLGVKYIDELHLELVEQQVGDEPAVVHHLQYQYQTHVREDECRLSVERPYHHVITRYCHVPM